MVRKDFQQVMFAHIGGSGTWGCDYPAELKMPGVTVLEEDVQFETPYGLTSPMKLIELSADVTADHQKHLMYYVVFHGWRGLAPHDMPTEQLFYIFQQSGTRFIIADGSAGSVNPLLDTGDIVIPHDLIDLSKRPSSAHLFTDHMVRMNDALCPCLRKKLFDFSDKEYKRVFSRGIYCNSEPPRFETAAEIQMERLLGGDITGHTMAAEASLARAIGACFAGVYIISNYAEGVKKEGWTSANMFEHYYDCGVRIGRIVLNTILSVETQTAGCSCAAGIMPVPQAVHKKFARKD
jgi:5'-methylthioadenosine phosphorylase